MYRTILLGIWLLTVPGGLLAQTQPAPILSLTFEGNKIVDSARLRAQLRMSRDGGWYRPETLNMELRNLENYYQDEGFLSAKVGAPYVELRAVPGKGQAAVIRVPISEGPRYVLGELIVKNAQVFRTATLLQMSPLRSGQPYSRQKIRDWREKIEDSYHTLGHIRFDATVKEDIHEFRRVVDCTLELKEGNAYRVGKIAVVGDNSIDPAQFRKLLLLGQGSAFNPENLSLSIQFLNTLRTYRPITDSDVDIHIDDAKSTVDLTFRVTSLRKPSSSSD